MEMTKNYAALKCFAVQSDANTPTFQRSILPPSLHHISPNTRHRIQQDGSPVEVPLILQNRITSLFFWDVAPRRWVIGVRRFETPCKFRLQMSK
jgi:hypothetical protein